MLGWGYPLRTTNRENAPIENSGVAKEIQNESSGAQDGRPIDKNNFKTIGKKAIGVISPNPIRAIKGTLHLPVSITRDMFYGAKSFITSYRLPKLSKNYSLKYKINYVSFIKSAWYILLWPAVFFFFSFALEGGYSNTWLWDIDAFFAVTPVLAVILTPLILNMLIDRRTKSSIHARYKQDTHVMEEQIANDDKTNT